MLSSSLTTYMNMAANMRKTTTHVIHFFRLTCRDERGCDASLFAFREWRCFFFWLIRKSLD